MCALVDSARLAGTDDAPDEVRSAHRKDPAPVEKENYVAPPNARRETAATTGDGPSALISETLIDLRECL